MKFILVVLLLLVVDGIYAPFIPTSLTTDSQRYRKSRPSQRKSLSVNFSYWSKLGFPFNEKDEIRVLEYRYWRTNSYDSPYIAREYIDNSTSTSLNHTSGEVTVTNVSSWDSGLYFGILLRHKSNAIAAISRPFRVCEFYSILCYIPGIEFNVSL